MQIGNPFGGGDPARGERQAMSNAATQNWAQTQANVSPYMQYGQGLTQRFGNQGSNALQDYTDYLGRGVTDQQRAAYSNHLTGNVDRSFAQGQSDLMAQARAQGMSSPLDSSVTAGMMGNLYAQRAGALGNAGMQADQWARQMQEQNLGERANALMGAAQTGANLGMQGSNLLNSAGNSYVEQLSQVAQMAQQAAQARQQMLMNGLLGLGSLGASFFTKKPQTSAVDTNTSSGSGNALPTLPAYTGGQVFGPPSPAEFGYGLPSTGIYGPPSPITGNPDAYLFGPSQFGGPTFDPYLNPSSFNSSLVNPAMNVNTGYLIRR